MQIQLSCELGQEPMRVSRPTLGNLAEMMCVQDCHSPAKTSLIFQVTLNLVYLVAEAT